MLGQTVMCRVAGQAFELRPDHVGERVQCPLCGGEHPAPPIIPPPIQRPPIATGAPPRVRFLRLGALGLTLLCGIALGLLAGLAIAAATMPTEGELKATIAEQAAAIDDLAERLAKAQAETEAFDNQARGARVALAEADARIEKLLLDLEDERKLTDQMVNAYAEAKRQLEPFRSSRSRK